ncbi:type II toxin-antitoxin system Phd/YefM family antitoxin [Aeromicrobium sp. UC242_57]|uniref:type II toxin-antitoxin system Phd/YefM family antitoxin n=1 Tax=Aeromicrobium sp. UC242_57 TaxID=3374624 RepID=UPI0037AEB116
MTVYPISKARAELAALLDEVERGGEVVITRNGRPAARLVKPAMPSPRTADIMQAADRISVELDLARRRKLSPPDPDAPPADALVSGLRADRDSW